MSFFFFVFALNKLLFSILKNDTTKVFLCCVNLRLINETSFFSFCTFSCSILFTYNQICMHLLSYDLSFNLDDIGA
jgi:hypothetical protein